MRMAVTASALSTEVHLHELGRMPFPRAVLMCPPKWFDVVDVKNPYMEGQQGHVDTALARDEWRDTRRAFESIGVEVRTDAPIAQCEDMVFCANPVFTGLDGDGRRVCVLSHMRFQSRQKEVTAHAQWFAANGYELIPLETPGLFEGSGDALWHPGRRLIWGGYGFRTSREVYQELARIFDAPVIPLELRSDRFYHLDTCLCPLDEETALVYRSAFSREGYEDIRRLFRRVIEVKEHEARGMACNAAPFFGTHVVVQRGLDRINRLLREFGFTVIEVETSEFMKSGGSVFCMKMYLF